MRGRCRGRHGLATALAESRILPRMRTRFHDRHDRLAYPKARAVARRLRDDPGLVEADRAQLERFAAPDPYQRQAVEAGRAVLGLLAPGGALPVA